MNKLFLLSLVLSILSKFVNFEPDQSFLGLAEIQELLDMLDSNVFGEIPEESLILVTIAEDEEDEIKTGDELGIRAGGEPPLKTGEAPRNTIVASTKMRFKIPDMNA